MVERFSGKEQDWPDWSSQFESWADLRGVGEYIKDVNNSIDEDKWD